MVDYIIGKDLLKEEVFEQTNHKHLHNKSVPGGKNIPDTKNIVTFGLLLAIGK